ncbi:hypothetical protein [Tunturiibacter gelidiferens]|uniref:hypothetical protein n=1 Tax=Tunturiibacter gelidiferens TaxID=3069689 RepID=UPI003D9ABB13
MERRKNLALFAIILTIVSGCKRNTTTFVGHKLSESFTEFAAIEHPSTSMPPGVPYFGVVHCLVTQTSGDECKGPRQSFDNAHFTLVNGKVTKIEAVGDGGIIGDVHQNWNWNLYLGRLAKEYGKPDKVTARDVVWRKGNEVLHAYLVDQPLMFNPGMQEQVEHFELTSTGEYEQSQR